MVQRNNTFFARMIVPKDVQAVIGQKVFLKSVGKDPAYANIAVPKQVAEWKAMIAAARFKGSDVEGAVAAWKISQNRVPMVDPELGASLARICQATIKGLPLRP